jgi:hypothetical protein
VELKGIFRVPKSVFTSARWKKTFDLHCSHAKLESTSEARTSSAHEPGKFRHPAKG